MMMVIDVRFRDLKLSLDDEVQMCELLVLLGKDLATGESMLFEVGLIGLDFDVRHSREERNLLQMLYFDTDNIFLFLFD